MTTTADQLQSVANEWAKRLPPTAEIQIHVWVYAGARHDDPPCYSASLRLGHAEWRGIAKETLGEAMDAAEGQWRADGAPTEEVNAERAQLIHRAKALGLRVVETESVKS